MITYIDGPFYADTSLPAREQKKLLREQVYTAMKEKSKLNDVELIRYVKVERENDVKK